jgi:membrane fusion protein (multidrug efflux system)
MHLSARWIWTKHLGKSVIKNLYKKINMKKTLYLAAVVFLASCGGSKPKDQKTELEELKQQRTEINNKIASLEASIGSKATPEVNDVAVMEVKQEPFKSFVEVQGRIDAEENVQVNPEMPGVVTSVNVHIGQNVGRGQVLAQIDDIILRQNISQLQTQIDHATDLYNRQKNLWDQKIGTEVAFLSAKAQKDGLEKQMAVLRSQLDMYKIKSPISGTIDQMDLKVGQAVMPGASGIRVINANNLKVKALVAESYAGRVNQGGQVTIILPDVPDTLNAQVSFVSKIIDQVSRSFSVEVRLPSRSAFRPNMLAILRITDYKNDKAITIPLNVIQKAETGDYVFIAENGKAKRVNIKTGKYADGKAEILSGLKAGDQLIIKGMQDLDDGDTIKI